MFRVFFTFVFASSLAFRVPLARVQGKQTFCSDQKDCDSCLIVSDCFAAFQPGFHCIQYPIVPDSLPNASVIVDTLDCCPKAVNFHPKKCGFPPLKPAFSELQFVVFGSVAFAGIIMLVAVVVAAIICVRRRKTLAISSPVNTLSSRQVNEHDFSQLPSTSRATRSPLQVSKSPIRKDKTLANLLQEEIKAKAEINWEERRNTLRNHPLDQTTNNSASV